MMQIAPSEIAMRRITPFQWAQIGVKWLSNWSEILVRDIGWCVPRGLFSEVGCVWRTSGCIPRGFFQRADSLEELVAASSVNIFLRADLLG